MADLSQTINVKGLVDDLKSKNPNVQYNAARRLGDAGVTDKIALIGLCKLTKDNRYQFRETGMAAEGAVEALVKIVSALGDKNELKRGKIVNHLIDCLLLENSKASWAALNGLKDLCSKGRLGLPELDKLESLLSRHGSESNIRSWSDDIKQIIQIGRQNSLVAANTKDVRLTGKYGTEAGDLTTELINSGRMTREQRRLLQLDLEAIEKGTSTE